MNLAFWLIVLILIGLLWFGLCSIFGNVGEFFINLVNDAKSAMCEDTEENEEKNVKEK